jgi:hypothetical protein
VVNQTILAGVLSQNPTATPPHQPPVPQYQNYVQMGAERDTTAAQEKETKDRPAPLPALVVEHMSFLRECAADGVITKGMAWVGARAFIDVWEASGYALPVPAACSGPNGQMLYSWDRGRHHLELELFPQGEVLGEFFYRDRESDELWSEEYEAGGNLKPEIVRKLRLFI